MSSPRWLSAPVLAGCLACALVATACSAPPPTDFAKPAGASSAAEDGATTEVLGRNEGLDGVTLDPVEGDRPGFRLDLEFDPTDIRGMVTPTGVPVAVLGVENGRYLVAAPCGDIQAIAAGEPIVDVRVVLDPGHGGPIDTGAVGPDGLVERDINLVVAQATEAVLRDRGIGVALTRTGDYAVPLAVRAIFADNLQAELMVSIHHNSPSAEPSAEPGVDVFVQSGSADSSRAGGLVREELMAALDDFDDIQWVASQDTGVLVVLNDRGTDAYGMMAYPNTVTVLAELGYLSNPEEEQLMKTLGYLQAVSMALADAVEAYLHTDRPGSGFSDEARIFNPDWAPGADTCVNPEL